MKSLSGKLGLSKNNLGIIVFCLSFSCFFVNTNNIILNLVIHSSGMIPLAFMLGELTSGLSEYIGEKKGGLLTATLGNLPEIIMSLWSIKLGLISMVHAALVGSIISNVLLVLGISIFLGGIKYKQQSFKKGFARSNFNILLLAISSMAIIACINNYAKIENDILVKISVAISIILIIVYILSLVFSLYTHNSLFVLKEDEVMIVCSTKESKDIEYKKIIGIFIKILIVAIAIYFLSENIINDASEVISKYNVSQVFMGVILIPLLGNIGEGLSAIICAIKNKVNLSLEIAIGSSIQIALFAMPLLVIISFLLGVEMLLLFSIIQIITIVIAIFMSYIVFADGNTYWFEGVLLISVYIIITICYFYI